MWLNHVWRKNTVLYAHCISSTWFNQALRVTSYCLLVLHTKSDYPPPPPIVVEILNLDMPLLLLKLTMWALMILSNFDTMTTEISSYRSLNNGAYFQRCLLLKDGSSNTIKIHWNWSNCLKFLHSMHFNSFPTINTLKIDHNL